jgi:hypothetical protein
MLRKVFVSDVLIKNGMNSFDDNLSVTHVFIKQIFMQGNRGSTPLPPTPHRAVQGVG